MRQGSAITRSLTHLVQKRREIQSTSYIIHADKLGSTILLSWQFLLGPLLNYLLNLGNADVAGDAKKWVLRWEACCSGSEPGACGGLE